MMMAVALMLLATPVWAEKPADKLSDAQRAQVQEIVRQMLKDHPEMVLEAIDALEAKEAKEKQDIEAKAQEALKAKTAELTRDADDGVAGNPKGDVTLVEFFDYRCGYCKGMVDRIADIVKADGHVRVVYKEFPILGPNSIVASKAAIASMRQGKYLPFHDALMASKGNLDEAAIYSLAKEAGLDVERLKHDMSDPAIDKLVTKNKDLAKVLDIDGTPGFIIGEQIIRGASDEATLKQAIAQARAS
jgi:protein-disulfide isomerase